MIVFDNDTLEAAAQMLERLGGNPIYEKAWRAGAKKLRAMKKLTPETPKLTDKPEQITSISAPALGNASPGVKAGA